MLKETPEAFNAYAFVTESAEPDKVLALINKSVGGGAEGLKKELTAILQEAFKKALGEAAAEAKAAK